MIQRKLNKSPYNINGLQKQLVGLLTRCSKSSQEIKPREEC